MMRPKHLTRCVLRLTAITILLLTGSAGKNPGQAETEPHLFYGISVFADPAHQPPPTGWGWEAWMPAGFDWIKLWEDKAGPLTEPPSGSYNILYQLYCDQLYSDLDAWGDHVAGVVSQTHGFVRAYEVCNEPNTFWEPYPDPAEYLQMLQEAYTRIKAIDPEIIVVAGGLAPVGRVQGNCKGYDGNDCQSMDELKFWRAFFERGGGEYFDVFSIHPYGFAYPPETDPYSVSNNFCFRNAELQYAILEQYGYGDKPVWATEFGWLRAASEDGQFPGWCSCCDDSYRATVKWIEVSETQQADYLERAFQYADQNWPWMHGMFLWNLDWYDEGWLCEPSRYYSIMRVNYDGDWDPADPNQDHTYHPGFSEAHAAVSAMSKRPAGLHPKLRPTPGEFLMVAAVGETLSYTFTSQVDNPWYDSLTWTAAIDAGQTITPTLLTSSGSQGDPLTFAVSSTPQTEGTHSGGIIITATPSDTVDSPFYLSITHLVWSEIHRLYLPAVYKN
ncbi:MAG: hypothetical protein ACOYZ7_20970 [Chloroflexota bacterium]